MIRYLSWGKSAISNIFSCFYRLLCIFLLAILVGCQTPANTPPQTEVSQLEQVSSDTADKANKADINRADTKLVLNNAILEQTNPQENTVWKIKADSITYSEDKQTAMLKQMVGNLLQNGQTILQISANSGEVRDNGNIIILKQKIIAQDPRNQSTIKSSLVEWQPRKNLLLIKENLTGTHQNLKVTAQSGRYFTDKENLTIKGKVIATTTKPDLQLMSDRLDWNIAQQQIASPGTVKLVRYDQNRVVTDRLVSDRAKLDLAKYVAILNENVELLSLKPKLQAATNSLTWNYQNRLGRTDQPIQILDRERQISLTGNQGEIDLERQLATLDKGVQGINQQKPSELYAQKLVWEIDTKRVTATGNVIYQQENPQAKLTGEKAVGSLSDNNIVVTSNGKQQVTSIIDN